MAHNFSAFHVLPEEEWRAIPGFPKYEVSNMGNVRHIRHRKNLRGSIPYNKYRQVKIINDLCPMRRDGKYRAGMSKCIHQLVALAFLGPRPQGYEVHHKDHDRANNRLDNLEYIPLEKNRTQLRIIEGAKKALWQFHLTPFAEEDFRDFVEQEYRKVD